MSFNNKIDVEALKALGDACLDGDEVELESVNIPDAKNRLDTLVNQGYATGPKYIGMLTYSLSSKGISLYARHFVPTFSTKKVVDLLREQTAGGKMISTSTFMANSGMPALLVMDTLFALEKAGAISIMMGAISPKPLLERWVA